MSPFKLTVILLIALLAGCAKMPVLTPESQAEADKAIDIVKARELSDAIANNLLKNDRIAFRQQMEKAARDYYDDKSFGEIFDAMYKQFGKPLEAEFKKDELGKKVGINYDKPLRKFWYAVKTTEHDFGTVFLFVEIVPDEDTLGSSGVSLVTFPMGPPPDMK